MHTRNLAEDRHDPVGAQALESVITNIDGHVRESRAPISWFNGRVQLVFIHGRAQEGRDPDVLKQQWIDSLHRGADAARRSFTVRPDDVIMPYYGDTLAEITTQEPDGDEQPPTDVVAARPAAAGDDLPCEVLQDCLDAAGVEDEAVVAEVIAVAEASSIDVATREPSRFRSMLAWEWVQTGLSILDRYVPGVSAQSIRWTTHDVAVYLDDETVRAHINAEVAGAFAHLTPTDEVVVVAHSLGSVVAYDLLRPAGVVDQPVHTLVTVGSPLGLRAVRRALAPIDDPPTVHHWLNAYDDRDVIALHPLDVDDFPFEPPIENHATVTNDTFNHHGIAGYLSDPLVAATIIDAALANASPVARLGHRYRTLRRRIKRSSRHR